VFLTYSNDPNVTTKGESGTNPDEPKPNTPPDPDTPDNPGDDYNDPVGVTPWSDVNTFTTAIKILKVDNENNPLKGVTFKLTGDGIAAVLKSSTTFAPDASGTYYPLTNGTYTKTPPTEATKDKYTGGTSALTYKETTSFSIDDSSTASATNISATVDDSGMLIFKGLGAGTYTLAETDKPSEYNSIPNITIVISNDKVDGAFTKTNPNWKVTKAVGSEAPSEITATDNIYELQVINAKGSTLPTTGGIGTKLFYIIGSLLVAGSVVLLVTKKRMGVRED
ncbi:MAG: LPXTG cell wall anchor domain-containing protein, partial [Ruminococcus sp.]|nr:LPXTG cell wall anchor domain-containing protein [Ruminococcus sp.]